MAEDKTRQNTEEPVKQCEGLRPQNEGGECCPEDGERFQEGGTDQQTRGDKSQLRRDSSPLDLASEVMGAFREPCQGKGRVETGL